MLQSVEEILNTAGALIASFGLMPIIQAGGVVLVALMAWRGLKEIL